MIRKILIFVLCLVVYFLIAGHVQVPSVHEACIAKCVQNVQDETHSEIVGCESAIRELDFIASNLHKPSENKLFAPPTGVLLYGPPGTGKTMLARSMAKRCECTFVVITPDVIENKYVGESNKYLKACFTYAEKHTPCVIYIDELDGMLSERSSADSNHTSVLKTLFLQLVDKMKPGVLLLGATNRLDAIDSAVKRRFPIQFYLGPPNAVDREKMIKVTLKDQVLAEDVCIPTIAETFGGMTYSQIYEDLRSKGRSKSLDGKQKLPWTMSELCT